MSIQPVDIINTLILPHFFIYLLKAIGLSLFLSTPIITHAAAGDIILVNSATSLRAALDSATGGETIRLTAANYGLFNIHNYNFSEYVTIRSDNNRDAEFTTINFQNTSYVRLDQLTIVPGAREAIGIFNASHHIQVLNSELYGANQFNRLNPDYTQVSTLYGVNTNGNVHHLLIQNNDAHDFKNSAYLFVNTTDSIIKNNRCNWVASDCFKLASAEGILFENNVGAQQIHASPTAHIDFVQGQGDVKNSIFRGNVALMGTRSFQGLFFDDATYENLTFENNIIYTANIRGISVSGAQSTGIVARYNTVLRTAGTQKASLILLPAGSVKEYNIEANNVTKNSDRFLNNNIVTQWDDANDIAHYQLYYTNALHGPFANIEDLRPVADSPADGQFGAFARIRELLQNPPVGADSNNFHIIPLNTNKTVVLPF